MYSRKLFFIFLLVVGVVGCSDTEVKPPLTAQAHYQQGLAAQQQGNFKSAIEHFEEAVTLQPDFGLAYCALGAARVSLDQRNLATTAYRQCVVLIPANVDGHAALGVLLATGAQPNEAVVHLQRSIDLGTQDAQVYFRLAEIRNAEGQCEVTVGLYERALALNPGLTAARHGLDLARKNNCKKPVVHHPKPRTEKTFIGGAKALKPGDW